MGRIIKFIEVHFETLASLRKICAMYYARLLLSFVIAAAILTPSIDVAAQSRKNRNNARQSARQREAARRKAINNAIASTKARLEAAERAAQAATAQALYRQAQAGESTGRYQAALRDKDLAELEAANASQELEDIRQRVADANLQGSELWEARVEYESSVAALDKIRTKIYESDKFQLLYEAADGARNRGEEIEKVMQVCFEDDPQYAAAKAKVLGAKSRYDRLRFELYEAEPDWADAVARARAASAEKNRAATSVKASAVEGGLEASNAKAAARRAAVAQSAAAEAKAKLQQLEKKKPAASSSSQSGKKK
jgi:hypothetical protein